MTKLEQEPVTSAVQGHGAGRRRGRQRSIRLLAWSARVHTFWSGMPLGSALASMRLISDELLPALRRIKTSD